MVETDDLAGRVDLDEKPYSRLSDAIIRKPWNGVEVSECIAVHAITAVRNAMDGYIHPLEIIGSSVAQLCCVAVPYCLLNLTCHLTSCLARFAGGPWRKETADAGSRR